MASILIIGSTSTVGRSLGRFFEPKYDVSYAGRNDADIFLNLEDSPLKFESNSRFDVVINAAAHFGGESVAQQVAAEKINAIGAINICEIAQKVQAKRLVMISSISAAYQFGDAYYGSYSLSKRHGDELAQLYCQQHDLPLTILRPSQLYDAHSECRKHQALFYSIIDNAEQGDDISFYGANDSLRNLLYLGDFCEIVARSIEYEVNGTFRCAHPKSVRLSQIANVAYKVFSQGGQATFDIDKPDIADLPDISQGDLYKLINYIPKTDLTSGIQMIKQVRVAI